MMGIPRNILESAQRIAASNGGTVEGAIRRYMAATRKSAVSAADFFWGNGDISLREKKSAASRRAGGRAAGSRRVRGRFKGEEVR